MKSFGQVLTAMITPFHEDGSVNFESAVEIANHLLDNGSDGIVVSGTTGEGPNISENDKLELFKAIATACSHRGTIIANTGCNNTERSVEFTKKVNDIPGIHGIMAVVPYYNKPNQEGLYLHFKAIADATNLPVMLYNVPSRTGGRIESKTVERLAKACSNIVAIKEASGDVTISADIRRRLPNNFMIYSGDDSLVLPILALGGEGVVSVSAHVVGKEMKEMIQAFLAGDLTKAVAINCDLIPVINSLFITTNPIPVKYAMKQLGFNTGALKLPLCDPSQEEAHIIDEAIKPYHT